MTVLCGGGTSSAQPQYGEVVYVAPAALGAFLNNIPTIWAVAAAGWIGAMTFRLATYCTTDPPAVPTFTAQDVVDLLNPYNPLPYTDAQQKFQDLIGAFMWHDLCKCDNGTVPTLPTPPAAPTGMPNINPPSVGQTYPVGLACHEADNTHHFTSVATGEDYRLAMTDGISYIIGDFTNQSRSHESIGTVALYAIARNTAGTALSSCSVFMSPGSDRLHQAVTVPAGTAYVTFEYGCTGGLSAPLDLSAHWQFFCGSQGPGSPVGNVPQPCPTDPFVQATLDQILALVTIIQRQQVPFAYVPGTVHSGLTGNGHISVQGLIGLKLQVDSYGSAVGQLAGDPMEFYDAGWFAWGGPDGYSRREFITHSPQVSLPAAAGQYTSIGYSLGHDVEVTITELVRES